MHSFENGNPLSGKRRKKLSVSEIRSKKEFQNITDAEAEEIIESLFLLSILTYKIFVEAKVNGKK